MTTSFNDGQLRLIDQPNDQSPISDVFQASSASSDPLLSEVPIVSAGEAVLVSDNDFILDEFQVVRREFFAHMREPSVSFNNFRFAVNTACIARFPHTDYVQVLVDSDKKLLVLKPCTEETRDCLQWCSISKGKRKPREVTGKIFFAMIVDLMGWNPHYRYKVLGRLIRANGEHLLAFDLTAHETFMKVFAEGEKPKTTRNPVFPSAWKCQFGLPYSEHKQSMQINIFDGFAVYTVPDPIANKASHGSPKEEGENSQKALMGGDGNV